MRAAYLCSCGNQPLGFCRGDRENQQARETLLDNLKERGLQQVERRTIFYQENLAQTQ